MALIENRKAATAGTGQSPAIDLTKASPIGNPEKATKAKATPLSGSENSLFFCTFKPKFSNAYLVRIAPLFLRELYTLLTRVAVVLCTKE